MRWDLPCHRGVCLVMILRLLGFYLGAAPVVFWSIVARLLDP